MTLWSTGFKVPVYKQEHFHCLHPLLLPEIILSMCLITPRTEADVVGRVWGGLVNADHCPWGMLL